MRETDPVDESFILSSEERLEDYSGMTLQRISELHGSIAEWQAPGSCVLSDDNVYLSDVFDCKDANFTETTVDMNFVPARTVNVRYQPMPVPDPVNKTPNNFNVYFGNDSIAQIHLDGKIIPMISRLRIMNNFSINQY